MISKTVVLFGSVGAQKKPKSFLAGCILSISLTAATNALCATIAPVNIDSGLQKLYAAAQQSMPAAATPGVHAQIATIPASTKSTTLGRFDASSRVLVHVKLNGTSTLASVSQQIANLKGAVLGSNSTYRHGIIAAYLPADQIGNCSALSGVRALTMEMMPKANVGKYTSQTAGALGTNTLNKYGLSGDGMTVGVISDSFNTAQQTEFPPATTAADDVKTGDLPVVNVLEDFPDGTDEGRAMCQVVYDEAPHCKLAFATAFTSEVDFANNIVLLRTKANCDVVVDDISYFDDPVFSDGLLSDAVNTVAESKSLPGKPVVYCSSAGNDGNNGYRSTYRNLTDADVRTTGHHGNLKVSQVDPSITAGGWFNWNTSGGKEPSTAVSAPGPNYYGFYFLLQWDDLFDQDHGITTNYNILVFDAAGNYIPYLSSTADTFGFQQPLQYAVLFLGTTYQIAITKTTETDPKAGPIPAAHQLALYTSLDGASTLQGKYFYPAPLNVPTIYGHPQADGAIAVAAYAFSWRPGTPYLPQIENFTSPGPSTIYFDQDDNRLSQPIVRYKPEVAGVDGAITTFFGNAYYNYPYSFFGTSCAAPSVAGVAALMLQAAGGPGSLDPFTIKFDLELSPAPRNSTVEMTQAFGSNSAGYVTVSALGQSYFGPTLSGPPYNGQSYFNVIYTGTPGHSISQLTINGGASGQDFYPSAFALGSLHGIKSADITVASAQGAPQLVLKFKDNTFTTGVSFTFSVSQDLGGTFLGYKQNQLGVGAEAEDLAYGASMTATFGGNSAPPLTEPFEEGAPTSDYLPSDGYGLVNAVTATEFVLPANSPIKLK